MLLNNNQVCHVKSRDDMWMWFLSRTLSYRICVQVGSPGVLCDWMLVHSREGAMSLWI